MRRLLVGQIVVLVVLGCGRRNDAMWHMAQDYVIFRSVEYSPSNTIETYDAPSRH